ncbi:MAG: N-6 DNA methylase [Candidatus Methanoperedens sp.]|nr:N-6 DNA methylase [Candidatus Methanoperedens sp.]MCZ7396528.1 N-6 DNA methylase [Candidatus Methanoperedens sp.]
MLNGEPKSTIKRLTNYFWAAGITNPVDYIEQISYLFFLKMLEENDDVRAKVSRRSGTPYNTVFDGENAKYRWSEWHHKTGPELLKFVRDEVFDFMRKLGPINPLGGSLFKDAALMIQDPVVLQNAIGIINDEIKFREMDTDVKGDLYEYLLSEVKTAGKNGQFLTPRHIIRFIVNMVDPRIGETIYDPACGTGGFLVMAYEHIKTKSSSPELLRRENGSIRGPGDKLKDSQWEFLQTRALNGNDNDVRMIRFAIMNLLLHSLEKSKVWYKDSLVKGFESSDTKYDVILSNPPFAGSIDIPRIKDSLPVISTKTEILFLGYMIKSLNDGGRCGVVVPEGLLFGTTSSHMAIRKMLLEKCSLEAVVSLPSGCFKPYAGVKTSVLVFRKGDQTEKVWFYEVKADGYSLDDKRNPTEQNDIPDLIEQWKKFKNGNWETTEKSWSASIEDIKKNDYNISASRYKSSKIEKIEYEDPKKLIEEVLGLEEEIVEDLSGLRGLL